MAQISHDQTYILLRILQCIGSVVKTLPTEHPVLSNFNQTVSGQAVSILLAEQRGQPCIDLSKGQMRRRSPLTCHDNWASMSHLMWSFVVVLAVSCMIVPLVWLFSGKLSRRWPKLVKLEVFTDFQMAIIWFLMFALQLAD